ncbi:MAG TPA: polyphenol oxidase family protein [Gemmatimonadaceae bacterium]
MSNAQVTPLIAHEAVPGFESCGVQAFTTTRQAGSFALASSEPASAVFGRWQALMEWLAPGVSRLAVAHQVHGDEVLVHGAGWQGWLRAIRADGHFTRFRGTAMAVTLADCVPVFMAHPSGAAAVLHSGWRGTVARIVDRGVAAFRAEGYAPGDLVVHLGPAICGVCYVVGADVYARLTGHSVDAPTPVDLRAIIADQARAAGVREITNSPWCTRCHNARFFSHRAGDDGRQLGVIASLR